MARRVDTARAEVGAKISQRLNFDGQDPALIVEGDSGAVDLVPAVHVGNECFAAVGDPPHGAAETACGPKQRRLLRIGGILCTEPAADIAHADVHGLRRYVEDRARQCIAHGMGLPCARIQGIAHGSAIISRDIAAGLDRTG